MGLCKSNKCKIMGNCSKIHRICRVLIIRKKELIIYRNNMGIEIFFRKKNRLEILSLIKFQNLIKFEI